MGPGRLDPLNPQSRASKSGTAGPLNDLALAGLIAGPMVGIATGLVGITLFLRTVESGIVALMIGLLAGIVIGGLTGGVGSLVYYQRSRTIRWSMFWTLCLIALGCTAFLSLLFGGLDGAAVAFVILAPLALVGVVVLMYVYHRLLKRKSAASAVLGEA